MLGFRPIAPLQLYRGTPERKIRAIRNTRVKPVFQPEKRLRTFGCSFVFEGRLCIKHLQSLHWHFLWRSAVAQSTRGPTIPGSMRPRTSDFNSVVFTMALKRAGMTHREAGGLIWIGTATSATRQFLVAASVSTGMGSTKATSAHIAAIATVTAIAIGADWHSFAAPAASLPGPGLAASSLLARELQRVGVLALRPGW